MLEHCGNNYYGAILTNYPSFLHQKI